MEATQFISKVETKFKSYGFLLDKWGIPYREDGVWFVHGKPDHDNKWMIFLSIPLKNAEQILDEVLAYLAKNDYAFVLIKDQLQHNRINNNAFPLTLFGKALMIFILNPELCNTVAGDLAKISEKYDGLFIPGCIRMGSIVYVAFSKLNTEYNGEEHLLPFIYESVENAYQLFPNSLYWKEKKISRFIKKRYLPISLIASSYKGNILKGLDLFKMKWVFIKQARPWATEDLHGRQMRDRLLWQQKVSEYLEGRLNLPNILDYVEQDGYCYLISQYIEGVSLDALLKDKSNSFEKLLPYYIKAVMEVKKVHQAGYLHRDITSKNIFIREGDHSVFLTDFELSYPQAEAGTKPFGSGTYGYMSPQQTNNHIPKESDDVFSLGGLLYYLASREHPNKTFSLNEEAKISNVDSLEITTEVKEIIRGCTFPDPQERWDINRLITHLNNLVNTYTQNEKAIKYRVIKTRIAISVTLIVLAFLTVFGLWKFSNEPNKDNNGFKRTFLGRISAPVYEHSLPKYVTGFAGLDRDTAYFFTSDPKKITQLYISNGPGKTKELVLDIQIIGKLKNGWSIQADSLGFALFDGFGKKITLFSKRGVPVSSHKTNEPFTRAVRYSSTSIAMRKFKPGLGDQLMYRYNLTHDTALNENEVTEINGDAGLITGGYFDCDGKNGCLYVTRYANHIYLLDTLLNVVKRGHTVDTFSHYTIKTNIQKNGNSGVVTNGSPLRYVNKGIAVSEGKIYIYSDVRADNETMREFAATNVIDVYALPELEYIGSYAFSTEDKERIWSFKVRDGKFYMFFPQKLKIYSLNGMNKGLKSASL